MRIYLLFIIVLLIQNTNSQNQFVDTSFGTNNGYTINQTAIDDFSFTDLLEHNGALYTIHTKNSGSLYIAKYTLNGIMDSSFGGNGFVDINNNSFNDYSLFNRVKKINLSNDNKLLITTGASSSIEDEVRDPVITKINLDGSFDLTYGENGQVRHLNSTKPVRIMGTYKYPQDEILLVCHTQANQNQQSELYLLKVDATGNYDTTFGVNGKITLPNDYTNYYPEYAIIKDNSAYIQFNSLANPTYIKKYDFTVANYDLNFGNNGKLNIENTMPYQRIDSFTIDDNNDIFVAGGYVIQGETANLFVLKFTDEVLNLSFGTNGMAQTSIATVSTATYAIRKQGDKLILFGESSYIDNVVIATSFLAALNLDGTFDSTFGENGIIINQLFNDLQLIFDYTYSDSYIITCGLCPNGSNTGYAPCLIKYTTNNALNIINLNTNTDFSYYPNPTNNVLYFKTDEDVSKVLIYDVLGRLVKSANVTQNKTDLSELNSGTYIVKVQTASEIRTLKVVKK